MVAGGKRWRLQAVLVALAVGFALTAGACGGDDSTAKDEPSFSWGSEPPRVFMERMAKLLATTTKRQQCLELEQINGRSVTRFACPTDKELRRSMRTFKVVGAKEYGTGAVVDYKSGKLPGGATILLFVAPDRNWGVSRFGVVTKPSTRTDDDDSREHFEETVASYLDAVRTRDCAAYRKVAFANGEKGRKACGEVFEGTAPLAKRLKANPDVEPEYQGGNATYGFFKLETPKPKAESSTISVVRGDGDEYVVMDVVPSPTAADQREAIEGYRKSKGKKRANGGMAPSTKSKPVPQEGEDN